MADRVASLRVGIRDRTVMADIGVHAHEIGRRQPLIVTVCVWIDPVSEDAIAATIDYRDIAGATDALAGQRIALIETFAQRLASDCLALPGVRRARVVVDKPQALPSGIASATATLSRAIPSRDEAASTCRRMREDA